MSPPHLKNLYLLSLLATVETIGPDIKMSDVVIWEFKCESRKGTLRKLTQQIGIDKCKLIFDFKDHF